jgi:uncharacterized membrane protein HdeD (DUF308 family)
MYILWKSIIRRYYVQEIYDPFVILMLIYIIIIVEGIMRCKPMFGEENAPNPHWLLEMGVKVTFF